MGFRPAGARALPLRHPLVRHPFLKGLTNALLASALLVSAVLGAGMPGAVHAQSMGEAEARAHERRAEAAQRRQAEQRLRLQRAAAHARMPSTMYASTPDTSLPPHPVPLASRGAEAQDLPPPPSASAGAGGGARHSIPLLVRASHPHRTGVVRLVNHGHMAGEVTIAAFDDAGTAYGPLTLRIGARQSVHLTSTDLERGSPEKSLTGATGPGVGDWRLEVTSALDVEVRAYVRTDDGLLASVHDVVPGGGDGGYRVGLFHAGDEEAQASRLRLVNAGASPAQVRIAGVDDAGRASSGVVQLEVPARGARTVTAEALATGEGAGIRGALGDGTGRWRLSVTSDRPLAVMSLHAGPGGALSNLSTVAADGQGDEAGGLRTHAVPWLPAAARHINTGGQGVVRLVNPSPAPGAVTIAAFDDAGTAYGPLTLRIGARQSVHLTATDLERGSPEKGLTGATGPGVGDWRLEVTTAGALEVLAYVRTDDGYLASVHDVGTVRSAGDDGAVVGLFHTAEAPGPQSRLRLVNPSPSLAQVRIEGRDDDSASPTGAVRIEVPARGARTVTAEALATGEGAGVRGALGDGPDRWRLTITSDQSIGVMHLLESPQGHLANLSTTPETETAAEVFAHSISVPIVESKCVRCHVDGGRAGATRLRFAREATPGHEAHNVGMFETFIEAEEDGARYLLTKVQGVGHGGGAQLTAGTPAYADLERFLALLSEDDITPPTPDTPSVTPQTLFDTVRMASTRKTLRRAALVFAGRIPTEEEYAAAEGGYSALRATIRSFMTGPEFHEFLIRGANDRLLTDREGASLLNENARHFVLFTNENYRREVAARTSGDEGDWPDWFAAVQYGARRAPVELIAYVVENDLPYTEILTADYIMANRWAAEAYGASTRFDDPEDVHEFKPSRIVSYYRHGEGFEGDEHPVFRTPRVVDPGPLRTDWPHAGILNTKSFLQRYPTTATNRNRARSRWTYYHFLGLDIEKSAPRTTDPVALADTNNPTMRNPACTVCHRALDPVAGAFQNYGEEGYYKDQWGGLDSLDASYKHEDPEALPVQATSWEDRETLSWSVRLDAGVQTLRVLYANDFYDPDTGDDGHLYLDRIRVTDARGGLIASQEFEGLGPPIPPPGSGFGCGHAGYDPAGRNDHVILYNGGIECAFFVDVEVPSDGVYDVEVVAWMHERHELYGEDGLARLSVRTDAYQVGDTWYRDMRTPGFDGEAAPSSDNSVQWLAQQIVADPRFAEAAVKFWWPALMGAEVAESPEETDDADFEGRLLAANAQRPEVERLARGFRDGFSGGQEYNLKDLLVEMVLSKWFRADTVEDADPVRQVALRDAGAKRLLTPEELERKTAALTGLRWGWAPRISQAYRGPYSRLSDEYRLLYGGIDSDGITERARDLTSVMAGVAKRHAVQVSCPLVMRDLFLVPEAERRLFAGIDRHVTPFLELGALFEIEAGSRAERETLAMTGPLTAGPKTVRLAFTNHYWDESAGTGRHVHLDRLVVRNAAGRMVADHELEELPSPEDCRSSNGDNFALWCEAAVEVVVDLPAAGEHTVEVVAWGAQAGDELPRLSVVVESDAGGSAGEDIIRSKLVELYDALLGVEVTAHSADVEAAYRLFVEVMALGRGSDGWGRAGQWFEWWRCDSGFPLNYFDGILDDIVVERENDDGWRWYQFGGHRFDTFMDSIDWSDPHHTAQAWVVVLTSLLMDYRYLYL